MNIYILFQYLLSYSFGGWNVPFRHFIFSPREKTSRRKDAMRKDEKTKKLRAKRRKDEITPCEKTKPAKRKDEISAPKDEKSPCKNTNCDCNFVVFLRGVFSSFRLASFRLRYITCIIRKTLCLQKRYEPNKWFGKKSF